MDDRPETLRSHDRWTSTGIARFDQLAEESRYFAGWTRNLEWRKIRLVRNGNLTADNPANYYPIAGRLEYNPETFRYIDLLHESRHIAQFQRAVAAGLDPIAPFKSARLLGWLESGALEYELRLAARYGFSLAYVMEVRAARDRVWPWSYQKKYGYRGSLWRKLNDWWR
jgi:hypothetical protein